MAVRVRGLTRVDVSVDLLQACNSGKALYTGRHERCAVRLRLLRRQVNILIAVCVSYIHTHTHTHIHIYIHTQTHTRLLLEFAMRDALLTGRHERCAVRLRLLRHQVMFN